MSRRRQLAQELNSEVAVVIKAGNARGNVASSHAAALADAADPVRGELADAVFIYKKIGQ